MRQFFLILLLSICINASTLYYYENDNKINVEQIETGSESNEYKNSNNQKLKVNDTIIVKFKSIPKIEDIKFKYNIVDHKKIGSNIYLFNVNTQNVFLISSIIFEQEDAEFSHPNFIKQRRRR